jgi:hypothetical protein
MTGRGAEWQNASSMHFFAISLKCPLDIEQKFLYYI